MNARVVGASPDTVEDQAAFKAKFRLPFTLLSDPDHAIADAYGAWGERVRDGKTSMGILRSSFIIDPEGRIRNIFRQVTAQGHARELLAALGAGSSQV